MTRSTKTTTTEEQSADSMTSTMNNLKPDLLILILGATGAGKSQFANELLGRNVMRVGNSLEPLTLKIETAATSEDSELHKLAVAAGFGRAVVVDTPGFDNIKCADMDIVRLISDWMIRGYTRRDYIGVIVHLHDISISRPPGAYTRNLMVLQGLIGDFAFPNVVIGTTKHAKIGHTAAAAHSIALQSSHWTRRTLIEGGATVACVDSPNAQDPILQCMRRKWSFRPVLMQIEVAMQHKPVQTTAAARALRHFYMKDTLAICEHSKTDLRYHRNTRKMLVGLEMEEQLARHNAMDLETFEQLWYQRESNDCNVKETEIAQGRRISTILSRLCSKLGLLLPFTKGSNV